MGFQTSAEIIPVTRSRNRQALSHHHLFLIDMILHHYTRYCRVKGYTDSPESMQQIEPWSEVCNVVEEILTEMLCVSDPIKRFRPHKDVSDPIKCFPTPIKYIYSWSGYIFLVSITSRVYLAVCLSVRV